MVDIKETKVALSIPEEYGDMIESLLRAEHAGPATTRLHLHQREASLRTMEFLKTSNLAQVVAPAGSGKTGILDLLIYLLRAKKTMILTPSVVISRQISEAISFPLNDKTFFERAKIFKENETKENKNKILLTDTVIEATHQIRISRSDVVIVNAQKLVGNSKRAIQKKEADEFVKENLTEFFGSFSLLIVDEAHRFPAPSWKAIIKEFIQQNPNGKLIFITATPYRNQNGREIRILDEKFESYNIKKCNLQRGIVRPLVFKELKASSNTSEDMMKDLANKLFQSLEEHDRKENRFKHQAMVLVQGIPQAFVMEKIFNKIKEKSTKAIVGGHKLQKNVTAIEEFARGKFSIALICGMLKEGYDNPYVSICVVYQNLKSRSWFEQFLGRCTRRVMFQGDVDSGDKTEALLISYEHFGIKKVWEKLDKAPPEETIDIEFIREFARSNVQAASGSVPKQEEVSRGESESVSGEGDVGAILPLRAMEMDSNSSHGEENLAVVPYIKPEVESDKDESNTFIDSYPNEGESGALQSSRNGMDSDFPQSSRNGRESNWSHHSQNGSELLVDSSPTASDEDDSGSTLYSPEESESDLATIPKAGGVSMFPPCWHAKNVNHFRDGLNPHSTSTPLGSSQDSCRASSISQAQPDLNKKITDFPETMLVMVTRKRKRQSSSSRAHSSLHSHPANVLKKKIGYSQGKACYEGELNCDPLK